MKAFDTDVLTLIFLGAPGFSQKVAQIPAAERSIPIVVAEQILRGRLSSIRQAEAGKAKAGIDVAYSYLERTIADLKRTQILTFTPQVEALVQSWKKQKIKVGIGDMRIAAVCIVHSAMLISRNRRDFDQIPGLTVEYW
jgi:tRNA(fMet)-specific endonuclease VapC